MLVARVISLVQGRAGVRREVVAALAEALNQGIRWCGSLPKRFLPVRMIFLGGDCGAYVFDDDPPSFRSTHTHARQA